MQNESSQPNKRASQVDNESAMSVTGDNAQSQSGPNEIFDATTDSSGVAQFMPQGPIASSGPFDFLKTPATEQAGTFYDSLTKSIITHNVVNSVFNTGAVVGSTFVKQLEPLLTQSATSILGQSLKDLKFPTLSNSFNLNFLSSTENIYERNRMEIERLRSALANALDRLCELDPLNANKYKALNSETGTLDSLYSESKHIYAMLGKVSSEAGSALLNCPDLQENFFAGEFCEMFVVSIDIRRSTELILNAVSPEAYVSFLSEICEGLTALVKTHNGVVDKFTGDGIIAYFPNFFSGETASSFVLSVCQKAHDHFFDVYRKYRSSFKVVTTETGLGIGVDYGKCKFVRLAEDLTVIGEPIVYACRFACAPAGRTFFNQGAMDKVVLDLRDSVVFDETNISIKHYDGVLAYELAGYPKEYNYPQPAWRDACVATTGEKS